MNSAPLRRTLLVQLGALIAAVTRAPGASYSAAAPVRVGAIRWDAWHGDRSDVGKAVVRSLTPAKWHYRLPFFAQVLPEGRVQIDGASQQVVDREIRYARMARLDYWAFLLYEPDSAMNYGLQYYLSSRHQRGLRFCLILEQARWTSREVAQQWFARVASLMGRPGYQLVSGDRPLLYILTARPDSQSWGARHPDDAVSLLRTAVHDAGHGEPYVVILNSRAAEASTLRALAHADAIGAYACQRNGQNAPYAQLAREAEQFRNDCLATGSAVVPIVMTGWDRRPRVEHPVPWETWQRPGEGIDRFYGAPTSDELSTHLRDAVRWVNGHPGNAPSKAILIYAWNENDEGGWLVPTLQEGTRRVEAVGRALRLER